MKKIFKKRGILLFYLILMLCIYCCTLRTEQLDHNSSNNSDVAINMK